MKHALAAFFLTASAALGQPTLANSDDIAAAKDRANHTGTQAHTTITGLGTAATANVSEITPSSWGVLINPTGINNTIHYSSDGVGVANSAITITYVISGTGSSVTNISVSSLAITVTCGSATTANTVASAVNADGPASALVTAVVRGLVNETLGDAGIGVVAAVTATPLSNPLSESSRAGKIPQFDSNQNFSFGPLAGGNVIADALGNINIPVGEMFQWYQQDGTVGAYQYLMDGHSGGDELFTYSPRMCFYFDQGFQFGQPYGVTARAPRFVYFNALGTATVGDPTRESISLNFNGNWWNGTVAKKVYAGQQWVPTSATDGEMQFWTGMNDAGGTGQPDSNGRLASAYGAVNSFSIRNSGPLIPANKALTFGDGTTMTTAPNLQARTGNATLVAGTVTVANTSTTAYTNILLTRRAAVGTVGDLTYSVSNGVGFTINSSSAADTSRVTYHLIESLVAASAPTVSGTNAITDTLTVSSGGGSSSWQWYSNGISVANQTASTYVIRHEDIGLPITCREDGVTSNAITAWHPDDETGYFADYRADTGTLKTGGAPAANGDAVETWQDQSGNARHLTQATGTKQPLLDTAGTGGRPTLLDFDATDDGLARTIAIARPYSVFLVAEADTVMTSRRYFSTASSGSRMIISQEDATRARYSDSVNNLDATGQVSLDTRNILFGKTSASLNEFKVNSNPTLSNASGTTANGSEILVSQSAVGGGADIKAYALLIYTADLDAAAQLRVRQYLKAKWTTP